MPPRGNQPHERVCEANWRRSLCAAKRDPRLRGCTPLRTPIRKSEGPQATRTQYYCSRLTPVGLPPLLSREFPRTPDADNGCFVGAAYMPPATYRGNPSTGKGPGCRPLSPLSSATRLRQSVGAGHARPAASPLPPRILCIVGRGLDRLTAHNERRQPAKLARSCGCLPCRGKHCSLPDFAPLNRGPTLTTPHLRGASGTPPPTTQSAGLLITANVRGGLGAGRPTSHFTTFRGAGLRPQLIHATL